MGLGGHALAEGVERGGDSFMIDAAADGEDLFDCHAGYEAAGELAAYGGTLEERAQLLIL